MHQTVDMSEIGIMSIDSGDEMLETSGLSTCICIMLKGSFLESDFILMHHWSGFETTVASAKGVIECLTGKYSLALDKFFKNKSEEIIKPIIYQISIIGGQQKQLGNDGELLCSGTLREIKALDNFFLDALAEEAKLIKPLKMDFKPFITKDDQSLTIRFNAKGETCYVHDEHPENHSSFSM